MRIKFGVWEPLRKSETARKAVLQNGFSCTVSQSRPAHDQIVLGNGTMVRSGAHVVLASGQQLLLAANGGGTEQQQLAGAPRPLFLASQMQEGHLFLLAMCL